MENSALGRRSFLSLAGLSLLGVATRVRADAEPLAVIVSAKSSHKELSLSTLRRIFLNLPTDDSDRNRFMPINAAAKTPLRMSFDRLVLDMDADEVGRYWVDQRIRGIQAPRVVPEFNLVRGLVSRWPGAISYLPLSQVRSDLKPLAIEGKLPGAAGYALRW
jgi:hypothetical protein